MHHGVDVPQRLDFSHASYLCPRLQLPSLSKLSHQPITKALDAIFKLAYILRLPLGPILARHGFVAREANIQNILVTVSLVAIQVLVGKAELRKGNGCLSRRRLLVGVTPDTIPLRHPSALRFTNFFVMPAFTYDLIVAYDCHYGERLHAVLFRIKKWRLIKDDVRVDVGVEVADAVRLHGILERRLSVARRVIGTVTGLVIHAVAVNVHVVIAAVAF